jgi:hypothetical protein
MFRVAIKTERKIMTFKIGDMVEVKSIEEWGFVHDREIGKGKRNLYLIDEIQGEGFSWFRQDDLKLINRKKED